LFQKKVSADYRFSTGVQLIASASECMAEANIAPLPLIAAAIPLNAAMS
jgi:hypothetical protein